MEQQAFYVYLKLILESGAIWQVLAVVAILMLILNRAALANLPAYVARFKVGNLEVELREVKKDLAEARKDVAALDHELTQERQRLQALMDSFDPHAPVHELAPVRQRLRTMAAGLDDMAPVLEGLQPGADAEAIYAAAEILRTRRDPAHFDVLVATLDRLAGKDDLDGVRLHTVWTLTSALHKMLITDVRDAPQMRLTRAQLQRAEAVLERLMVNPRVMADRPDDPHKGVSGPATWARDWIGRGLRKLAPDQP